MRVILMIYLLSALVAGCGGVLSGVEADGGSDTESDAETDPEVGEVDPDSIENLLSLYLDISVSPTIPDSVAASGPGFDGSAAGNAGLGKSAEACYLRKQLFETKTHLDSIASNLCMIASQPGMKLGGKYKIEFSGLGGPSLALFDGDLGDGTDSSDLEPGGDVGSDAGADADIDFPESISIFLDNSIEGKLTIYSCTDDELTDKFLITDVSDTGARGAFKSKVDFGSGEMQINGAFDNGVTEAGRSVIASQSSLRFDLGSEIFYTRSKVLMSLKDDAVSILKIASEQSDQVGDFSNSTKEVGSALIGPDFGSALYRQASDGVETTRSFFDNAGNNLAQEVSDSFAKDGNLFIPIDSLPKLMDDKFKVEFEEDDWDCSGTETIVIEENDALSACQDGFSGNFPELDCGSDEFAPGTEVGGLPQEFDEERSEDIDPTGTESEPFFDEIGAPPPLEGDTPPS